MMEEEIFLPYIETQPIISTQYPFSPYVGRQGELQAIGDIVSRAGINQDTLRSSAALKKCLGEVVMAMDEAKLIKSWTKQNVKVRLDILMKMLVAQLCIPHIMTMVGVGTAFSWAPLNQITNSAWNNAETIVDKAKIIISEVFSLFCLSEELVLETGSDDSLDYQRFSIFIRLLQMKCSPLIPTTATVAEYGFSALDGLSRHILSVTAATRAVAESIEIVIKRINVCLDGETRNYSLAERLERIEAIVMDYFSWLRQNMAILVKDSRKEEILASVDQSIRSWLKAEEYSSPADILVIYKQKYADKLTHIPVPLQHYKAEDLVQAKKDVVREKIAVNKVSFSGGKLVAHEQSATSEVDVCTCIKSELRKVLTFNYGLDFPDLERFEANSRLTTTLTSSHADTDTECSERASEIQKLAGAYSPPRMKLTSGVEKNETEINHLPYRNATAVDHSNTDLTNNISDDGQQEVESIEALHHNNPMENMLEFEDDENCEDRAADQQADTSDGRKNNSEKYLSSLNGISYRYTILDLLFVHTLLACSRTFASGDAFFVLNDIYGGDDLMFCPYTSGRKQDHEPEVCLVIHASGIKITLVESYSLFATASIDACSSKATLKSLMNFQCITTTLIKLPAPSINPDRISAHTDNEEVCFTLFRDLISNLDNVCRRAISIKPFI